MPRTVHYDYTPSPGPQTVAHHTFVDEMLYGGAAGGGKSRMARAEAVLNCLRVPGFRAIIFRRTFPDLERSVVEPLLQEIPRELGRYNSTKHLFRFFNGSILELGHLQRRDDLMKYQGAEYSLIVFEEATHFVYEMFDYMRSRLRAGGQVAERLAELNMRPRMILTANPGGVGHHWVKREFIDPAPAGKVWRPRPTVTEPDPPTRCYVPAKATDNPYLDKGYINRLNSMSDNLRRALRDGDWDVLDGVRFPDFSRNVHVIEPEQLPIPHVGYRRAVGIDYGSSAPFAAVWAAKLPDNLIVIYRELYQKGLTPRQQAELIRDSEAQDERRPERPIPLVLDPSMWARSVNNPLATAQGDVPPPGSIAHAYYEVFGSEISKARNDRIGGWALVEEQLRVRADGLPRLLIHSTCTNLIRTLAALPRDIRNPDDVDCFIAGTMISTPIGPRPVETLQSGDLIDTPMGPQPVIKAEAEPRVNVARVELSNGTVLIGTADHEVVTEANGLVQLRNLKTTDRLITQDSVERLGTWTQEARSFIAGTRIAEARDGSTTSRLRGSKLGMDASRCTETSTPTLTGRYLRAITSITRTATRKITRPKTSNSSAPATTQSTTTKTDSNPSKQPVKHGNEPLKLRPQSGRQWRKHAPTRQREQNRALIVESLSRPATAQGSIAQAPAKPRIGDWSRIFVSALSAAVRTGGKRQARGTSLRPVPINVDGNYGVETVYALTVDGCALYYANGVLVTNTHAEDHLPDAARYVLQELIGQAEIQPFDAQQWARSRATATVTGGLTDARL